MSSKSLIRSLFALALVVAPIALMGCDSGTTTAPATPATTPGPNAGAGPSSGAAADAAKAK